MSNQKIPLALPVSGFRRGLLGNLPVDAAYLRGVEASGRMLAKACRLKTGAGKGIDVSSINEYAKERDGNAAKEI